LTGSWVRTRARHSDCGSAHRSAGVRVPRLGHRGPAVVHDETVAAHVRANYQVVNYIVATVPRERFEQALTELYTIKGWDPETAIPTRERLRDLGIEWAADWVKPPSQ
jgi:hypothetical protein